MSTSFARDDAPERTAACRPAEGACIAALHRARFLGPLCAGRRVLIDGAAGAEPLAAAAASVVASPAPPGSAEVVLALDPAPPEDALAALPDRARALRRDGVLAVVCRCGAAPDPLPAALGHRFRHVATFRQRRVAGTLVADARTAASRVVVLAAAPAQSPEIVIHLASAAPLPDLAGGLFEVEGGDGAWLAAGPPPPPLAAPRPAPIANPVQLPAAVPRDETARDLRRRAVALVGRLVATGERSLALNAEIAGLRRALEERGAGGPGAGSGFFDVPRTRHDWPLADNPGLARADLEPFDHRVDDDAVLEGRAGEAFLGRFGLTGDEADFAGAIAALNAMPKTPALTAEAPDVSVIVPVYGQLGYTLNCLDSLFRHQTRARVEIIVVDDVSPDQTGALLPGVGGIRVHRQAVNGGFITSCNTGAAMAGGRILVMLNNDTRVVEGWLDALVDSFAWFPRAGLVGSKLLYPDGILQEAGGIIWRDGSAWNYGRNDDPNRPQYSHARQIDYVSGASIALPAALWRALGGFDRHYAPAYNEDSDLGFRVRAAGHETWFQPQSRVIHYEGKTSGTDTRTGVKAYQVVNAKKFYLRWRDTLAAHRANGQAPYFERERGVQRRALVIDATAPTPNQDAGSVTTVLNIQLLRDLGYKVHFVPQDNFLFQRGYTTDLQRQGVDCAYAPYEVGFEPYIRRYGHLFDVVLVFRVTVLEKVIDALRRHAPQAPVLFNNMDLHFLRMRREARLTGDRVALAEAAAMMRRELAMIARVDCTITPSTYEKRILERIAPKAPTLMLPFMIDFAGTAAGFDQRRDICFLGGYRHAPNIDAVKYFVEDVFPRLKAEEPDIRFIIAGAHPSDEVKALARDDVIVTGLVPELRDVFDRVRVFACSLRAGAGVKGKVSAAMSYGLPVVTTSVGAEGMDLIDGTHILRADTPEDFAAACLRAYRDEALWRTLSEAGQALVQDKHSLAAGRRVLQEAIEMGLRHKLELA